MEASTQAAEATPTTERPILRSESRADWFVADAFTLSAALDEKTFPLMVDAAEQFLWSGLTWERWSMLGEDSRAAFAAAGVNLAKQKASWIAESIAMKIGNERE